jgi:hypothetical protein
MTACGCANGLVMFSMLDEYATTVAPVDHTTAAAAPSMGGIAEQVVFFDGPISSIALYCTEKQLPHASDLHRGACAVVERAEAHMRSLHHQQQEQLFSRAESDRATSSSPLPQYGMVVGGALGFVAHFPSVTDGCRPLSQQPWALLPVPPGVDAVTGVLCADVDADGQLEVVAATFGNTLLVFGQQAEGQSSGFGVVKWARRFPSPLLGVLCAGLTGGGGVVDELVVLGWKGCHVLQPAPAALRARALAELKALAALRRLELDVDQLEQS